MKSLWNKKAHMIINIVGGILIILFGIFHFLLGYYAVSMIINGLNGFLIVDIKHSSNNRSDIRALKVCECVFLLFFLPGVSSEHFIRDIGAILLYNGLHFIFLGMLPAYIKNAISKILKNNSKAYDSKSEGEYSYTHQEKEKQHYYQYNNYEEKKEEELVYFGGCDSLESLKKRYYRLAKAFHSDEKEGDNESFVKMKEEYEKELKKYL